MKKEDVDPSYCNNVVLRQAARRLGQLYDGALVPSGLRATQQGLLSQIVFMGHPTLRELAEALVMDLSALGHALKALERDGWVQLSTDPNDRRAKRVALAPESDKRFEESLVMWHKAQSQFEAAFGKKEAADLRAVLIYIASGEFAEALENARC